MLLSFCYFLYVINANRNTQTLIDEQQDKNNSITLIFLTIGLISLIFGSRYAVIYAEKIAILLNIAPFAINSFNIACPASSFAFFIFAVTFLSSPENILDKS